MENELILSKKLVYFWIEKNMFQAGVYELWKARSQILSNIWSR